MGGLLPYGRFPEENGQNHYPIPTFQFAPFRAPAHRRLPPETGWQFPIAGLLGMGDLKRALACGARGPTGTRARFIRCYAAGPRCVIQCPRTSFSLVLVVQAPGGGSRILDYATGSRVREEHVDDVGALQSQSTWRYKSAFWYEKVSKNNARKMGSTSCCFDVKIDMS